MQGKGRFYWIHALSPLHVGTGVGLGYIDLPLMREKGTNWPLVPGSSTKGVLRDHFKARKLADFEVAFGPEPSAGDLKAGAFLFTDSRLVCLPVRSFFGTFAWCTCPLALRRLRRDLESVGATELPEIGSVEDCDIALSEDEEALTNALVAQTAPEKVYLEDLDLKASREGWVGAWARWIAGHAFAGDNSWQTEFRKRFAVLPDDVFTFLAETATEVTPRVSLDDESKTVKEGPWYEESLPAESILAGIMWCDPYESAKGSTQTDSLLNQYANVDRSLRLQMGGNATIGRGQILCRFTDHSGHGG
jgi:CRISPR-associated protein Cmr4